MFRRLRHGVRGGLFLLCAFRILGAEEMPSAEGFPPQTYFPPTVYRGHSQVFQTAQDSQGIVYLTNFSAVLSYDGERWGRIPVPDTTFLYGLVALPDDRLAVSGVGQIGLLEPDGRGGHTFRSLLPEVPEADRDAVGECWDLYATPEGLFFFSRKLMLRWRNGEMKVWRFETDRMIYGFWSGSAIYVQELDKGLFRLQGDELTLVNDGPLMRAPGPRLLVDWDDGTQLIGTMREGLWLLRGGELERWETSADPVLAEGVFNRGVVLPDGRLALGTFQNGVVLLDHDGTFQRHLQEATGLPHNGITHLSVDREGGLWCSLGSGVVRVDLGEAMSYYDRRNGLPAVSVTEIVRFRRTVYLASASGLFRLQPVAPPAVPKWERIPEVQGEMHDLLAHEDSLFAAVQGRVERLDGDVIERLWDEGDLVFALAASPSDPDRVYVGGRGGLGVLVREAGQWRSAGHVPGFEGYVQSIAEDADGAVWAGTLRTGLRRITSAGTGADWVGQARVETFGEDAGVPTNVPIDVATTEATIRLSTFLGGFVWNPETETFVEYAGDERVPVIDGWLWDVRVEDDNGNEWGSVYPAEGADDDFNLYYGREYTDAAGERVWEWIPPGLFDPIGGVLYQYFETDESGRRILWVGGWTGLLRWDLGVSPRGVAAMPLEPLIREVAWDGVRSAPDAIGPLPKELRFAYAAPAMAAGVEVEYRTRLRGFEEQWSPWGSAAERAFTNLREGDYVFEVEARTDLGISPAPASWGFEIEPPWFRTGWAYAGYLVLGAIFVWLLVHWRLRRIRAENEQLEALVDARTAELRTSEQHLRIARDEANRANRAKSEFLANMSHELRTPLNGILGYAQVLARDPNLDARNRERVAVLEGSGQHLHKLINEVLDLSKIEARRFEVKTAPVVVENLIRTLTSMFRPRIEEKHLGFDLSVGPGLPERVVLDEQKVGQVLFNLLGNAVKFTRAGSVGLRVDYDREQLCFSVSDTGAGIAPEVRERIFEPFAQLDNQPANEAGTGLGLAISRRLAEVMGGTLEVESTVGTGTCFTFRLPAPPALQPIEASSATRMIAGYAGPRRRVLVVDDVATNRGVVRELLEPLGFVVEEAAGGEEALARVADRAPDVMLLDMRMAPVDGAETVRRLRAGETGHPLPVVAFSASAIDFTREDARALGCDEFISKPFRSEDLLECLRRLLSLKWEYTAAESAGASNDFRFAAEDLGNLRALARRGEPAGLKRLLAAIADREPTAAPLVEELQRLVARFRLEELHERLGQLEPRS